jgi:hypothetical protein
LAKKTTTGVRYYKKIGLGKFISDAFLLQCPCWSLPKMEISKEKKKNSYLSAELNVSCRL